MHALRILIVEDEAVIAADLAAELELLGYQIVGAVGSGEEAIERAGALLPDLILMDIGLGAGIDGITAAREIRKSHGVPVIFLTAHSDPETLRRAGDAEPLGYIVKPFDSRELRVTVEMAQARRRIERRHQEMERWLATTLQSIGDGVLAADLRGDITFLNHRAEQLTGWSSEEAHGLHYTQVFRTTAADPGAAFDDVFQRVIAEGVVINLANNCTLLTRDGHEVPIDHSAAPIRDETGHVTGVVLVFRDRWASEALENRHRRIEEKLRDAQKLESLGVMAGGVAHDFNNILTAILGHATLAALVAPSSPVVCHLRAIESAAARAADLCKQMLAYTGKGAADVRKLNLSTVVEDSADLLRLSISKRATLQCRLEPNLPPVQADATQLHQVLMNLIINASDAFGEKPGTITVTTGRMHADHRYLADCYLGTALPKGEYVFLEVSDDGCGMEQKTLAKIFDPFFTTKVTGRGLGLAAVLGIIRSHRGALNVWSEPGQGARFKLILPAVAGQCDESDGPHSAAPFWKGAGTILVIDDETFVRATVRPMLTAIGFDVLEAPQGEAGVEIFRQQADEIDAVLLDLTMPRLDGAETFRRIRQIRADTPVILISGYTEQEALKGFAGKGLAGFLQKPFRVEALRDKLRAVLRGRERSPVEVGHLA